MSAQDEIIRALTAENEQLRLYVEVSKIQPELNIAS